MHHEPFIALTDEAWFEFLSARALGERLDEVNFWSPSSKTPMKRLGPGEPVFFRLKSPKNCIVGYGFFAHFCLLGLRESWEMFGEKNGDPDFWSFCRRIAGYRKVGVRALRVEHDQLGCTILRDVMLWGHERWLPWGAEQGWKGSIQRGTTERDPARASRLLAEIQHDSLDTPEEFTDEFVLLEADERELILARTRERVGQGTFRSRLLDAYERRCAITGERTEPVLDAAHVQPYLGPRSNHVQNGLLLTKEFHTLFDLGFVTITPDYRVRVSPALNERWSNGKRYYVHDSAEIHPPKEPALKPSREALEWHGAKVFLR